MIGCDQRTLRRYKSMIDTGYGTTFGEGMVMEAKASKEYMATVSAGAVASRRADVQKRGREQGS